jgi:hypothetical protein
MKLAAHPSHASIAWRSLNRSVMLSGTRLSSIQKEPSSNLLEITGSGESVRDFGQYFQSI